MEWCTIYSFKSCPQAFGSGMRPLHAYDVDAGYRVDIFEGELIKFPDCRCKQVATGAELLFGGEQNGSARGLRTSEKWYTRVATKQSRPVDEALFHWVSWVSGACG
jgi:hypothetical protein